MESLHQGGLTQPLESLLVTIDAAQAVDLLHAHEGGSLEISKVISTAAGFYEKVRYMVDYREEHTIRRSAIERILRRILFIQNSRPTGELLLQELVESKYVTKELVGPQMIAEVDAVLAQYLVLLNGARIQTREMRHVVSFAASAVDVVLSPVSHAIDTGTAEAFYATVRTSVSNPSASSVLLDMQTYCACYRALLGSDDQMLAYALWRHATAALTPEQCAQQLSALILSIEHALKDEMQWTLARRLKDEAIFFRVIREIVREKGSGAHAVLSDRGRIATFTHEFLDKRLSLEQTRIQRSGVRAVMYLLMTKLILVAVVEWPYEHFILGSVNYVPLAINALFHPLLLFGLTRRVGVPGSENTEAIVDGVFQIVTRGAPRALTVRANRQAGIFGIIYFLMTLGLFGGVAALLQLLDFTIVGGALFVLFLALVMYFAFRVRYRAAQWKVSAEETGVFFVWQLLALPIVRAGQWLSRSFSSINLIVVVMDFILETPFRLLLNFSHQFLLYMREQADGVY